MPVRFECNGRLVELDDEAVHPHISLLSWLRASGATGSKEGCAEGECGACAVAFVEPDARGRSSFVPVNSCLVPLAAVHGRKLISVEGLDAESGELHPVQRAMVEQGGSQCGYCTPGFVVSMFSEYYRPERAGFDLDALSGNLCRCTGYRPIVAAAQSLGMPEPCDPHLCTLSHNPPTLPSFATSAAGHTYLRPSNLVQLFELWAQHPAATLIAGGTDLMVYANQRDARYQTWIALDAVPELQCFQSDEAELQIGAALPLSQLDVQLKAAGAGDMALLAQLLPLFASRLVRNRASVGGNLATASPIGDAAPVLLALDAELLLQSQAAQRRIALQAFFTGYRKHAMTDQELIRSIHIPRPAPRLQRFYKVSKRGLDDISTVSAAFALDLAADGTVERLRIAYGGVALTPLRVVAVEQLVQGRVWDAHTCQQALQALQGVATPIDDHRGSAAYRSALMLKLFEKFFVESSAALPRQGVA